MRPWLVPIVIGLAVPPWLPPGGREVLAALPLASVLLLLGALVLLARWRVLWPAVAFLAALALSGYRVLIADSAQLKTADRLHISTELQIERVQKQATVPFASITGRVTGHLTNTGRGQAQFRGHRLRLFWPLDQGQLPPMPGTRWRISGPVKAPITPRNPGGFQYSRWLRAQGIVALGSVTTASPVAASSRRVGARAWLYCARATIQEKLVARPDSGLLRAVLFGDFAALPVDTAELIRVTGTVHLFVVSGLHVGLIGALCGGLGGALGGVVLACRRQGERHRWVVSSALMGAAGFVWLTGGGVPALRALIMFAVASLLLLCGRLSQAPTALGASLILILLLDPMAALLPGTWLSFAAAGLLIAFWTQRHGRSGKLAAAIKTQLLLSLGSLLVLSAFNVPVSPWSGLYNLLLVPLLGGLWLPASCLALAGDALGLPGASSALNLCIGTGHAMLQGLEQLHSWLPGSGPAIFAPGSGLGPWLTLLLAGAALRLLLQPVSLAGGLLLAGACLMAMALPKVPPALPPGVFQLSVFDVGHGTAVLVETRSRRLLYDAGPLSRTGRDAGKEVVVPALRQLGVQHLDGLVISHDDLDHAGGEATLLRQFAPTVHWRRKLQPEGLRQRQCHAGQGWRWDQVDFRFLHPAARSTGAGNEQSCVLMVSSATSGRRALLTGDIGQSSEYQLLRQVRPGVDFLLVPHHGSAGSSGAAFVRWLHPGVAGVSVARSSRYGLPTASVTQRYQLAGARLASTSALGAFAWRSNCVGAISVLGRDPGGPVRQSRTEAWRPVPAALHPSGSCPPRFLRRDDAGRPLFGGPETGAGEQKTE